MCILEGVSNFEFHDFGAARVMRPIGKAFAEAMIGTKWVDVRAGGAIGGGAKRGIVRPPPASR